MLPVITMLLVLSAIVGVFGYVIVALSDVAALGRFDYLALGFCAFLLSLALNTIAEKIGERNGKNSHK